MIALNEKYPNSKILHFIEMYDNVIGLEAHALNAVIFEEPEYVQDLLLEIENMTGKGEEQLILNHMIQCNWTNEKEQSVNQLIIELKKALEIK